MAGTDGVGTKLKVAFAAGLHDTIGIDLVAMSVNDVAVVGAEPLFFLDYFATGRLDAAQGAEVVKGIAEGCRLAGCALIGGETAELPGFYARGEYDLAGFAVGCVERSRILDGRGVVPGDAVLGLASTGLHSNGYSLARRALLERHPLDWAPPELGGATLATALLAPTRIYALDVLALLGAVPVKALAHVTGGGLPGNVPRTLPDGTRAVLREGAWPRPPIFDLVQREGGVRPRRDVPHLQHGPRAWWPCCRRRAWGRRWTLLARRGLDAWLVGSIEAGRGRGHLRGRPLIRLAVLASGGGSNLGALLDACADGRIDGRVEVVLSDNPGARALERGRHAGAEAEVVAPAGFPSREAHEAELVRRLERHAPDLVCLAGYMRLLGPRFLAAFGPAAASRGCPRIVNIHPALLPSFPGLHGPRQALRHGVRFAGCTVHFVDAGADTGPIIAQAVVPVLPGDGEEALAARILAEEHRIYPQAVAWFAEGRLSLDGRRVVVRDAGAPCGAALRSPWDA